jgi:PAS domain S-box-containing protein
VNKKEAGSLKEDQAAVAALRKSELRYRRLFESAQDGILILDGETGAITDVNPFLLDLLGYPGDEMIGRHLWEIGELRDVAASKAAFAVLQEKEYVRYENLPLQTRSGRTRQVEFVSNVYDVEGERVIQCNIRDISLRSDAEEASHDRLLGLESAKKAKADVLAVLSHELRTPLSAISSMLDILELSQEAVEKLKPSPPATLFDNPALVLIRRNVRIGIRLLNELLDVTHLTRGKLQLNLEVVDGHQALSEILADFGSERRARQISIHTDLRARDHQISADPLKLHQILSNLLGNAIKFTPFGGFIDIATSNPTDDEFAIVIRDNGIGINPEEAADIFAPFVQGNALIHQRFGGLGLGLSICKKLMEAHRGSISVDSAGANLGSAFTLRFRRSGTEAASPPTQPGKPTGPLSILLVEDHEDSRTCMRKLLQMRGHEVIDAENGKEALQFAQSCTFDLLITDISLPDLNGLVLLEKIRETQPELEGIALSGYAMPRDVIKSKETGYLAHLTKPVSIAQLDVAIRKVVDQIRAEG